MFKTCLNNLYNYKKSLVSINLNKYIKELNHKSIDNYINKKKYSLKIPNSSSIINEYYFIIPLFSFFSVIIEYHFRKNISN
jgi:hypothetical protein